MELQALSAGKPFWMMILKMKMKWYGYFILLTNKVKENKLCLFSQQITFLSICLAFICCITVVNNASGSPDDDGH